MGRIFCFSVLILILYVSHANSDEVLYGRNYGTNYVPITRDCYLEGVEPGKRMKVKRGEPIYPGEKDEGRIWDAYYKNRYWVVDSINFPPLTDGIRFYRKFAWADAVSALRSSD